MSAEEFKRKCDAILQYFRVSLDRIAWRNFNKPPIQRHGPDHPDVWEDL